MLSDSILSNAGWLFLAAYGAVVALVNIAAFGGDVVHGKAPIDPPHKIASPDPVQPAAPR